MKRKRILLLSVIVFLLTSVLSFCACDQLTLLNSGGNGNGSVSEKSDEKPNEDSEEEEEEGSNPVLGGLQYRISTDGTYYTVTSIGTCRDSELVIPATYNGLPVTEIGKEAFYKCSRLTSVVIPDSITSIGEKGFAVCQNLKSVQMGNSLISVGDFAFLDCDSLTSVYASDIESWCNIEFSGDASNPLEYANSLYINNELVREVVIPNTVTKIPKGAFSCDSVTRVVIPNTVTEIGADAFEACKELTRVEISDIESWCNISFGNSNANPLSFAKELYVNNELLTDLEIPDTVTEIKNYAFYQCESLTSVVIPDSVTLIGDSAFYRCNRLTSVVIPDSVTIICERAFYWCNRLTSVVVGQSLTEIKIQAFQNCVSLVEVVNKSPLITVTKGESSNGHVGNYALAVYNSSDEFISRLSNDNGYIIYTDGEEKILIGYNGTETNLVFPAYVTKIHQYAFAYCSKLTSVVIGSLVTEIGNSAFGNCYRLVEVVNKSPFITITKGSKENGYVGAYALAVYDNDEQFTSNVSNDNGYIVYTDGEEKILIGYEGTERNLVLPTYLTKINSNAFLNSNRIISVNIGNSVTAIEANAFRDCIALTSIVMGDSVTMIGSNAFQSCAVLTSLVIPDSVTLIDSRAFADCTNLKSVVIGGGTIGFYAFENCQNLKSVVIGDSVTVIESYAFKNCAKLTSVVFEQSSKWYIFSNKSATNGTELHYMDLMDESKATKYLISTYNDEYWRRIDRK